MGTPNYTLVQLRYFVVAASEGSMTAASRELMVSQSAVSTAIAQLEKELGVQLLLRHHAKGLTLTEAGRAVYDDARRLLDASVLLADSAREAGGALAGTLALGCFTTLGPFVLPALLQRYEGQHPGVHVTVREAEHAALKQTLREGLIEIALMYRYDLDDPDLDTLTVGEAHPYVLVGASHRLAHRRRVKLAELADDPMVLLDLPYSSNYLHSIVRSAGIDPEVRHRSAGFETVRALVAHGHGFAILNQRPTHTETYDGSRVTAIEIQDRVDPLQIVIASMKGVRLTRRAAAFIRIARNNRAAL